MSKLPFIKRSYKTVDVTPELTPLLKFKTFEEYLFDRIVYIRDVLENPNEYTNIPDHNSLICELWRLLGDYQSIIGKKIKEDGEEPNKED